MHTNNNNNNNAEYIFQAEAQNGFKRKEKVQINTRNPWNLPPYFDSTIHWYIYIQV